MTEVKINNLHKHYGADVRALHSFSIDISSGEIVSLVGSSGCGKTTLLRCIAGFEEPDKGSIEIGENVVFKPKTWIAPEKRHVGFVFQEQALFPHLNVEKNILFAVKERDAAKQKKICADHLERVGLAGLGARYPHELSGGQQRRVALARVLAQEPRVVLLDEPLNGLDESLRDSVRDEVHALLRETGTTAIWVTHRATDALAVADRIAVLERGELVQFGPGSHVYEAPVSQSVAQIFGTINVLQATVREGYAETVLGRFETDLENVEVGIRPENLWVSLNRDDDDGVEASVISVAFEGSTTKVEIELPDKTSVFARIAPSLGLKPRAEVRVGVRADAALRFFSPKASG